jgi:hypothetical protein
VTLVVLFVGSGVVFSPPVVQVLVESIWCDLSSGAFVFSLLMLLVVSSYSLFLLLSCTPPTVIRGSSPVTCGDAANGVKAFSLVICRILEHCSCHVKPIVCGCIMKYCLAVVVLLSEAFPLGIVRVVCASVCDGVRVFEYCRVVCGTTVVTVGRDDVDMPSVIHAVFSSVSWLMSVVVVPSWVELVGVLLVVVVVIVLGSVVARLIVFALVLLMLLLLLCIALLSVGTVQVCDCAFSVLSPFIVVCTVGTGVPFSVLLL